MKKLFVAIGILFTTGVIYFVGEKVIGLNEDVPKTKKELQDIADTKYYRKEGEPFEINSVQFVVKGFTILKEQDGVTLLIDMSVHSQIEGDTSIESSFFVLKDEADRIFSPESGRIEVTKNPKMISLRYSLPAMRVGYFLYRLHLISPESPEEKSIIPLYKSYRSEG